MHAIERACVREGGRRKEEGGKGGGETGRGKGEGGEGRRGEGRRGIGVHVGGGIVPDKKVSGR